jgi:hypothetical protein
VKKTRQNKRLELPFRFNRNGKGSRRLRRGKQKAPRIAQNELLSVSLLRADKSDAASSSAIVAADTGSQSLHASTHPVSHWLRDREREGLIGAGTTLNGLRVTHAPGGSGTVPPMVADRLGGRSQRMGTHCTRNVTREDNVIRAFERVKDRRMCFVKRKGQSRQTWKTDCPETRNSLCESTSRTWRNW